MAFPRDIEIKETVWRSASKTDLILYSNRIELHDTTLISSGGSKQFALASGASDYELDLREEFGIPATGGAYYITLTANGQFSVKINSAANVAMPCGSSATATNGLFMIQSDGSTITKLYISNTAGQAIAVYASVLGA